MNFTEIRSSFSYIPDESKLLSDTGELSKTILDETPPSLLTVDDERVSNILKSMQYSCTKMYIFVTPTRRDSIQKVSITFEDYTVQQEDVLQSIELSNSVPKDIYYNFCYHDTANIVPFSPIEGILSISTDEYQGIVSVNEFEVENNIVSNPPSSVNTEISFFINKNNVHLKTVVNNIRQPDCTFVLDLPDDDVVQEETDFLSNFPEDTEVIYKEHDNLQYGCRWNSNNPKVFINGKRTNFELNDIEEYPFNIYANITNSCGSVCDPNSEHNNKIIVESTVFKNIPDELQKFAVRSTDVSDELVSYRNDSSKKIEEYMYEQLYSEYVSILRENLSEEARIVSNISEYSIEFVNLLFKSLRSSWTYSQYRKVFRNGSSGQLKKELSKHLGYETETDFVDFKQLTNRCYIAPIENPYSTKKHSLCRSYIGSVVRMSEEIDGNVYMGVNLQTKKTKVLKQDSREHLLVKLNETSEYETYTNSYGWKKQKSISATNISQFDISSELQSEFESSTTSTSYSKKKSSIPDRSLTVHKKSRYSKKTINKRFKQYIEELESSENILIIYPQACEHNLTDHKDLMTENIHLAAPSSKEEATYLAQSDSVYRHEEYIGKIESMEYHISSDDTQTFQEIVSLKGIGYTPVVHILNDLEYQLLMDNDGLHRLARKNLDSLDLGKESVQYIPVTVSMFKFIEPIITSTEGFILVESPDVETGRNTEAVYSLFDPYLSLRVSDSDVQTFFNSFRSNDKKVTEEFIKTIEYICSE